MCSPSIELIVDCGRHGSSYLVRARFGGSGFGAVGVTPLSLDGGMLEPIEPSFGTTLPATDAKAMFRGGRNEMVDCLEPPLDAIEGIGGLNAMCFHLRDDVLLRVLHFLAPHAKPVHKDGQGAEHTGDRDE